MKSGLKVHVMMDDGRLAECSNLCRDEKRTESIWCSDTSFADLNVATYAAMKSGLKGFAVMTFQVCAEVATYAAMKSGLKVGAYPSVTFFE